MGANEQLALESHLSRWNAERTSGLHEDVNPFEYYCLEQFLRDWIDSDEDLQSGMVGGGQDGGVDALYFFVNRELVGEETILDPKTVIKTDLLIFQMKEGDGFSPTAIDKLVFFTEDLLELTRPESQYHTKYRPRLLELMRLFKEKYREILGAGLPEFSVHYFYATKKDVEPNDDCSTSEGKLRAKVAALFSKAEYSFQFVNATKLWNQVEARPKKKKVLKWAAQPLETPEGPVGLVRLPDYYDFLKDEQGLLNNRIFESNVRGYWPNTPINKQILATLKNPQAAEFWLLNNGITILAGDTNQAGFTQLEIHDPQIVNGLQTSRQIYNYYQEAQNIPSEDNRKILVRVIKSQDKAVRDDVIRATNSQNKMPAEALRATDQIHRQIEELFLKFNLYYDRRKGHYRDEGKPIAQIVSIVEVLQAMLSCVVKRPDDARARPRNYFGSEPSYPYEVVFGEDKYNLNVYLKSAEILRRVERFLNELGIDAIHRRNLKFYLCMYVACVATKSAYVPLGEFIKIDAASISEVVLRQHYERVRKSYDALAKKTRVDGEYDYDAVAKGPKLLRSLLANLKRRFHSAKKRTKDNIGENSD